MPKVSYNIDIVQVAMLGAGLYLFWQSKKQAGKALTALNEGLPGLPAPVTGTLTGDLEQIQKMQPTLKDLGNFLNPFYDEDF